MSETTKDSVNCISAATQALSVRYTNLERLDLSQNTALTYPDYSNSGRNADPNLSRNTALKTVYCESNRLTQLDISANTALLPSGDNNIHTSVTFCHEIMD